MITEMDHNDKFMKFMNSWIDYRKFKGASATCAVLLNVLLGIFKFIFCITVMLYLSPFLAAHALLNQSERRFFNKLFYVILVMIGLVLCVPFLLVGFICIQGVWGFIGSLFSEPILVFPLAVFGVIGYWSLKICLILITSLFHREDITAKASNIAEDESIDEIEYEKHLEKNMFCDFVSTIESMNGTEFERFCVDMLNHSGYSNVRMTSASGDHGIDILADKDGIKWGIQCKHWKQQTHVGNDVIRDTYAGKAFYHCDKAAVITTSTFTRKAVECAKELDILLWDRSILLDMIDTTEANCDTHTINTNPNPTDETTMTIDQQMVSVVSEIINNFGAGKRIISSSELYIWLGEKYKTKQGSIIPSDYCYNRINDGIDPNKKPMLFEYLGKGQYLCLGENYRYNGNVYHKDEIVGICENGVRTLFERN